MSIRDVESKFGKLSFRMSPDLAKMCGASEEESPFEWYVWPEDLNGMEALMHDALIGPFKSEREARRVAKKTIWERHAP